MDKAKSEQIYAQYYSKVFGYLISKTNNKELAEDLASEVFLKVMEKLDSFDESKASISTWIYTITHNKLIDYYRGIKPIDSLEEDVPYEESMEDDILKNETLEMLAAALEKLGEREREIIVLRYYSGKTLREIADTLRISYSYVKVMHNKAMSELKKFMIKSL